MRRPCRLRQAAHLRVRDVHGRPRRRGRRLSRLLRARTHSTPGRARISSPPLQCHQGHQLIELYERRHFRCDCGTANRVRYALDIPLCVPATEWPSWSSLVDRGRAAWLPSPPASAMERTATHSTLSTSTACVGSTTTRQPTATCTNASCVKVCIADISLAGHGWVTGCRSDWFHEKCIKDRTPMPADPDSWDHMVCLPCVHKLPRLLCYRWPARLCQSAALLTRRVSSANCRPWMWTAQRSFRLSRVQLRQLQGVHGPVRLQARRRWVRSDFCSSQTRGLQMRCADAKTAAERTPMPVRSLAIVHRGRLLTASGHVG
jgi:hypothetical protein